MTSWEQYYLQMAKTVATKSKDPSTKVGCVLIADNRIVGTGYNGFPDCMVDKPEWLNARPEKYRRVIHAEMNALIHARKHEKMTCYTWPLIPCERCVVHLLQAGVNRFCFPLGCDRRDYDTKTLEIIQECGAEYVFVPDLL